MTTKTGNRQNELKSATAKADAVPCDHVRCMKTTGEGPIHQIDNGNGRSHKGKGDSRQSNDQN